MSKDLLMEVHLSDSDSPCSSGGTVQRVSRLCLSSVVGFQKVSTVPVFLSLMKISLSCEGKSKSSPYLPYDSARHKLKQSEAVFDS